MNLSIFLFLIFGICSEKKTIKKLEVLLSYRKKLFKFCIFFLGFLNYPRKYSVFYWIFQFSFFLIFGNFFNFFHAVKKKLREKKFDFLLNFSIFVLRCETNSNRKIWVSLSYRTKLFKFFMLFLGFLNYARQQIIFLLNFWIAFFHFQLTQWEKKAIEKLVLLSYKKNGLNFLSRFVNFEITQEKKISIEFFNFRFPRWKKSNQKVRVLLSYRKKLSKFCISIFEFCFAGFSNYARKNGNWKFRDFSVTKTID